MKLSLNLTTAMTLRKRLNSLMCTLESNLRARVYANPEMLESVNAGFIAGNFDADLDLYNRVLFALGALNQAITNHNQKGKAYLTTIQLANRQIATYGFIESALRADHKDKCRNPVTGEWEVTEYVPLTKVNAKVLLAEAMRNKNLAEDALSKFNAETVFDFELADDVYSKAYEV